MKINFNHFLTIIFFSIIACSKEDNNELPINGINNSNSRIDTSNFVYKRIIELGFADEDIKENDQFYIVEGDIAFPKKHKEKQSKQSFNDAGIVNNSNIQDIKIYLNTGSFSMNLTNALNTAIDNFNAILHDKITLSTTSQPISASITISNNNLGSGVFGMGGFPIGGSPYHTIYINESELINYNYTSNNHLTRLIEHEIGHCIGLRHTNRDEPGQVHIPSTPTSDANSIMNQGELYKATINFSPYDIRAMQVLYPEIGYTNWGSGHGNINQIIVKDFNNDNKADIAQISGGNSYVWLSTGSSFSYQGQWGSGHGNRNDLIVADFNNDNKTDIAQISGGNSYVWLSTGSSFSYQGQWASGHGSISDLIVADFNNDNKADIAQIYGGNSYVWLSTGSSFSYQGQWASGHGSISDLIVADFNNDNKTDIAQISGGNSYVWLSTGSNFSYQGQWASGHGNRNEMLVADLNSDDYADLVQISGGNSYVWTSTGNSFSYKGQWASGHGNVYENKIGDFNADGKDDIIQISEGVSFIWESTGTDFDQHHFWSSGHGNAYENRVAKLNSDSYDDIIQISSGGNSYIWESPN